MVDIIPTFSNTMYILRNNIVVSYTNYKGSNILFTCHFEKIVLFGETVISGNCSISHFLMAISYIPIWWDCCVAVIANQSKIIFDAALALLVLVGDSVSSGGI